MENRVSFEEFADKVGIATALVMCEAIIPSTMLDSFDFNDWNKIHLDTWSCLDNKSMKKCGKLAMEKMAEKAKTFDEWMLVYNNSEKESPEEGLALEKIRQLSTKDQWISFFKSGEYRSLRGKSLEYFKEIFGQDIGELVMVNT